MTIYQASSADTLASVRRLLEQYADSLGVDLSYQGFAAELAGLPGVYAPPRGRLLVAEMEGVLAGCVALRPIDGERCEMKRLYVRPECQGRGVGRELITRLIDEARSIGYRSMLLDTLPTMLGALRLYQSLGFTHRPAYFESPVAGNVFMELSLHRGNSDRSVRAVQPPS